MQLAYFQMIDGVDHLDTQNGTIEASARVPEESTIFEGHFPGQPILPGVLLIETMAQAGGYLIMARNKLTALPFLMTVDSAKLRGFVEPGEDLVVKAELAHEGSGFVVAKARIEKNGKRIADAQLKYRPMPFPNATVENAIRGRCAELGIGEEGHVHA